MGLNPHQLRALIWGPNRLPAAPRAPKAGPGPADSCEGEDHDGATWTVAAGRSRPLPWAAPPAFWVCSPPPTKGFRGEVHGSDSAWSARSPTIPGELGPRGRAPSRTTSPGHGSPRSRGVGGTPGLQLLENLRGGGEADVVTSCPSAHMGKLRPEAGGALPAPTPGAPWSLSSPQHCHLCHVVLTRPRVGRTRRRDALRPRGSP